MLHSCESPLVPVNRSRTRPNVSCSFETLSADVTCFEVMCFQNEGFWTRRKELPQLIVRGQHVCCRNLENLWISCKCCTSVEVSTLTLAGRALIPRLVTIMKATY